MILGICSLTIVPLRASASHRSEMVNQVRFGEIVEILEEASEWAFVRMLEADYTGWLQVGQYEIWPGDLAAFEADEKYVVDLDGGIASGEKRRVNLLPGTKISKSLIENPLSDNDYHVSGKLREANLHDFAQELPKLIAYYRDSPYLWGGRSVFGIDCSGLTQLIYAHFGIDLPRDAYQQAEQGRVVDFLPEIKPGDLAFFDNEQGKITHVGMMIDSETILHASAYVKIDKLDGEGIYHTAISRYTHKLRIVKRYF